jgi:hypothetical protein
LHKCEESQALKFCSSPEADVTPQSNFDVSTAKVAACWHEGLEKKLLQSSIVPVALFTVAVLPSS